MCTVQCAHPSTQRESCHVIVTNAFHFIFSIRARVCRRSTDTLYKSIRPSSRLCHSRLGLPYCSTARGVKITHYWSRWLLGPNLRETFWKDDVKVRWGDDRWPCIWKIFWKPYNAMQCQIVQYIVQLRSATFWTERTLEPLETIIW